MMLGNVASGANGGPDATLIWTIVAAIVGILALIAAIVTYRRQYPRRRLEYAVESTPMVSAKAAMETLQVVYDGHTLAEPYITQITMRSRSRADIPSKSFDRKRPLRIDIGLDSISVGDSTADSGIMITRQMGISDARSALLVEPQLIRKGASGEVSFVTDGLPEVTVNSPLVDIEVRRAPTADGVNPATGYSLALLVGISIAPVVSQFTSWAEGVVGGLMP